LCWAGAGELGACAGVGVNESGAVAVNATAASEGDVMHLDSDDQVAPLVFSMTLDQFWGQKSGAL